MAKASQAHGRVFIVGSARSGTTLLQAMLASHSRVFTLPETHFFCDAVAGGRRHRWTRLALRERAASALHQTAALAGRADLAATFLPAGIPWQSRFYMAWWQLLDRAAIDAGNDMWVEKTPHHIDHLNVIARHVPGARFIHVLRDGRDVVASQYHAQQQDPEFWREWSTEKMAETWNVDVMRSLAHADRPDHLLVSYESLITDPERELTRASVFLRMDYERSMLDHTLAAERAVGWRRKHPWMLNVFNPLEDTRLKKFNTVFSDDQRQSITRSLFWGGEVQRVLEENADVRQPWPDLAMNEQEARRVTGERTARHLA